MLRQEKVDRIADIKKLFEESGAYFITDYQGLNVTDLTALRKDLRENQVKYLVAKNTLFILAAKEAGQEGIEEFFTGPTAVAFASADPSVAAKILYDSNKAKNLPTFKAFVVEKQLLEADQIKVLAQLPQRRCHRSAGPARHLL